MPASPASSGMPEEGPGAGTEEISDDALLSGRVRLLQPRRGHRAGTDAVLLAGLARPREGELVLDLGAGTGAVGLMMAARAPVPFRLIFVERDPALVGLCRLNIARNGLSDRARAVEADVLGAGFVREIGPGAADVVVTNPPFLEPGRGRSSPVPGRASARELPRGGLEVWIEAAAGILKAKGRLALIHRADRLADGLSALSGRFGGLEVRPVHPHAGEPASRVLIEAVKGGRAPLRLLPPLVLHGAGGGFATEAAALHDGG